MPRCLLRRAKNNKSGYFGFDFTTGKDYTDLDKTGQCSDAQNLMVTTHFCHGEERSKLSVCF